VIITSEKIYSLDNVVKLVSPLGTEGFSILSGYIRNVSGHLESSDVTSTGGTFLDYSVASLPVLVGASYSEQPMGINNFSFSLFDTTEFVSETDTASETATCSNAIGCSEGSGPCAWNFSNSIRKVSNISSSYNKYVLGDISGSSYISWIENGVEPDHFKGFNLSSGEDYGMDTVVSESGDVNDLEYGKLKYSVKQILKYSSFKWINVS
jgi:hypothetical protein